MGVVLADRAVGTLVVRTANVAGLSHGPSCLDLVIVMVPTWGSAFTSFPRAWSGEIGELPVPGDAVEEGLRGIPWLDKPIINL